MANALDPSWMEVLKAEFGKDYMIKLKDFLDNYILHHDVQ